MARGGTTKRVNPAHLHATQAGELEMYTHDLQQPLEEWARAAYIKGHASDDDAQMQLANIYVALMQASDAPETLVEASRDHALEMLREIRGATPRELRPALRAHYSQMVDYAAQVGWTLPAQMDLSIQAQLNRTNMQVDDVHVVALARMRAATSLVAALDSADETDVQELELLRAHALASADEAWMRVRVMKNAPVQMLDAGRLYLACSQSRAARIRARRLAPEALQLKSIARDHGALASAAIVTLPSDSWFEALSITERPYVVSTQSAILVGPLAYRDLKSTDAVEQARARAAILEALLMPQTDDTSRESQMILGAWASHTAAAALVEAGLSEHAEAGGWQQIRSALSGRLDEDDPVALLDQWRQSGMHAGRTWQSSEGHLSTWA